MTVNRQEIHEFRGRHSCRWQKLRDGLALVKQRLTVHSGLNEHDYGDTVEIINKLLSEVSDDE
jgi:hypothetical protein